MSFNLYPLLYMYIYCMFYMYMFDYFSIVPQLNLGTKIRSKLKQKK